MHSRESFINQIDFLSQPFYSTDSVDIALRCIQVLDECFTFEKYGKSFHFKIQFYGRNRLSFSLKLFLNKIFSFEKDSKETKEIIDELFLLQRKFEEGRETCMVIEKLLRLQEAELEKVNIARIELEEEIKLKFRRY